MTEMVYGSAPDTAGDPVLPRWWRTLDRVSLGLIFSLFAIGILLGLAASPPLAEDNGFAPFYYVERQLVFGALALAVMMIASILSPVTLRRLSVIGFVGALVGIAMLPMLGTDFGKGAVRWYSLGFAALQPSEFLKPVYIVVMAWLMAASGDVGGPPGKRISLVFTVLIVGLLIIQPDFGQAALVLFSWGVMYFTAGAPMLILFVIAGLAIVGGAVAYNSSEHFARRIDGYLNPEIDPRTQLGLADNAIREGGFFGVGVGEGRVKEILPDAHTDFIIAVAAEEYGLVLVALIIALFAAIVLRAFWRLMSERDPFIRIAGAGLAAMIGIQAIINMGVAVRLLPAKGMTLPFVSYGGSSMIATGLAFGMLLALTRSRPQGVLAAYLGRGERT